MLKLVNLLLILLATSKFQLEAQAIPLEDDSKSEVKPETQTLFDDELREFFEFLRLQMKCGYEPAGIPPLAPYQSSYKHLQFGDAEWSFNGNFSDLIVTGLDEFEVRHLAWNNVKRKLSFDFNFEQLQAQSVNYQMDLFANVFGGKRHVYGNGIFNVIFHNLRMQGSFKLQPMLAGGLKVTSFNVDASVEVIQSKLTGVMQSKLYTKLFNSWLEEFVHIVINDGTAVEGLVENLLVPPMNKALKNLSFFELVAVILGLAGDISPNEAFC